MKVSPVDPSAQPPGPEPKGGTAVSGRLARAAHEFEALLLKQLIPPMNVGASGEGDETSGADASLSDMSREMLATAVANHGGIGVSQAILRSVGNNR